MVLGGSYGLSLPLWGFLCDLKVINFSFCPISHDIKNRKGDSNSLPKQVLKNSSKLVMGTGAVLIVLGFMIMGQFIENVPEVAVFVEALPSICNLL